MKFFRKIFKARPDLLIIVLGLFFSAGLLLAQAVIPSAPLAPTTSPPAAPSTPDLTAIPPAPQSLNLYTPPLVNALVNGLHSETQCTSANGEVVSDGSGNKFCRFSQSFCPSGWAWYLKWSTTAAEECKGSTDIQPPPSCVSDCTTLSHAWSNTDPNNEICTYTDYVDDPQVECFNNTCYPRITQIGCY